MKIKVKKQDLLDSIDICNLGYWKDKTRCPNGKKDVENYFSKDKVYFEDKQKTDTQVFVVKKKDKTIICFPGTASKKDVKTDAKFFKEKTPWNVGTMHEGVKIALMSLYSWLLGTVDRSIPVEIHGHSLGGGLAVACTGLLFAHGYKIERCWAIEPLRVFDDKEAQKWFRKHLSDKIFYTCNNNDTVPRKPYRFMNTRHVGNLIYIDRNNVIKVIKNGELINPFRSVFDRFLGVFKDMGDGDLDIVGDHYLTSVKAAVIESKKYLA